MAEAALPADTAARLLRAFCFLRQHERKTRAARKLAELQAWTRQHSAPQADDRHGLDRDRSAIADELERMQPGMAEPATAASTAQPADAATLRHELKELQRGLLPGGDASGCVSAADLASALRALGRPTSKSEAQWMIWEADDDLDGALSWDEFRAAFLRGRLALEPNQLHYVALFLLCDADRSHSASPLELATELRRLASSERAAESLLAALGSDASADAEQQLTRRLSLADFLRTTLTELPMSFSLH